MAKNMENTSYRKIDVDAYDPENYNENEDVGDNAGVGPDERTVLSLLQTNKLEEALHAALLNPPLKCKNQAVKDKCTMLLAKVLGTFKWGEVELVVKKISIDEADILMKFIYKAMELTPENALCQVLLAWHSLNLCGQDSQCGKDSRYDLINRTCLVGGTLWVRINNTCILRKKSSIIITASMDRYSIVDNCQ